MTPLPHRRAAPRRQQPSSGAKPRVAVVNYPLWYFTKRIAGDRVEIIFPVPREEDPAFWRPDANAIRQYQQADLILLNGADYAKWRLTSVLPLAKQIVTSASFADRYMTNGEVITHSHGTEGMHSHGLLDFNTWMDPQQAEDSGAGRFTTNWSASFPARRRNLTRTSSRLTKIWTKWTPNSSARPRRSATRRCSPRIRFIITPPAVTAGT